MNPHAYVCDKCKIIFWAEPDKDGNVTCQCGEVAQRLTQPSITSDVGGAVRISKDRYVDL